MTRLHTRTDKGHELLRIPSEDHDGHGTRYVAVHRLCALAWGELDSLSQPLEIHHEVEIGWYNAESNLQALEPRDHGRITRENARKRRGSV
jgi:hypothetical protein